MDFLDLIKWFTTYIIGNIALYISVRLAGKAAATSWYQVKCQYEIMPTLNILNAKYQKEEKEKQNDKA